MGTKVAHIKRDLGQWIDQNSERLETAEMSAALLETAFDRCLDLLGEDDARDLVNSAFDRTAQKRRGVLQ